MTVNRINGVVEVEAAQVARPIALPQKMLGKLNLLQAQVAISTRHRDGFLEACQLALDVPDGWLFSLQNGRFEPGPKVAPKLSTEPTPIPSDGES